MGFGNGLVQLQCLHGCCLRLRYYLARRTTTKLMVGIRQSSIGKRVVRVFIDGLLKVPNRLLHAILGKLVPVIAPSQVKVVSLPILRGSPAEFISVFSAEPQLQFGRN